MIEDENEKEYTGIGILNFIINSRMSIVEGIEFIRKKFYGSIHDRFQVIKLYMVFIMNYKYFYKLSDIDKIVSVIAGCMQSGLMDQYFIDSILDQAFMIIKYSRNDLEFNFSIKIIEESLNYIKANRDDILQHLSSAESDSYALESNKNGNFSEEMVYKEMTINDIIDEVYNEVDFDFYVKYIFEGNLIQLPFEIVQERNNYKVFTNLGNGIKLEIPYSCDYKDFSEFLSKLEVSFKNELLKKNAITTVNYSKSIKECVRCQGFGNNKLNECICDGLNDTDTYKNNKSGNGNYFYERIKDDLYRKKNICEYVRYFVDRRKDYEENQRQKEYDFQRMMNEIIFLDEEKRMQMINLTKRPNLCFIYLSKKALKGFETQDYIFSQSLSFDYVLYFISNIQNVLYSFLKYTLEGNFEFIFGYQIGKIMGEITIARNRIFSLDHFDLEEFIHLCMSNKRYDLGVSLTVSFLKEGRKGIIFVPRNPYIMEHLNLIEEITHFTDSYNAEIDGLFNAHMVKRRSNKKAKQFEKSFYLGDYMIPIQDNTLKHIICLSLDFSIREIASAVMKRTVDIVKKTFFTLFQHLFITQEDEKTFALNYLLNVSRCLIKISSFEPLKTTMVENIAYFIKKSGYDLETETIYLITDNNKMICCHLVERIGLTRVEDMFNTLYSEYKTIQYNRARQIQKKQQSSTGGLERRRNLACLQSNFLDINNSKDNKNDINMESDKMDQNNIFLGREDANKFKAESLQSKNWKHGERQSKNINERGVNSAQNRGYQYEKSFFSKEYKQGNEQNSLASQENAFIQESLERSQNADTFYTQRILNSNKHSGKNTNEIYEFKQRKIINSSRSGKLLKIENNEEMRFSDDITQDDYIAFEESKYRNRIRSSRENNVENFDNFFDINYLFDYHGNILKDRLNKQSSDLNKFSLNSLNQSWFKIKLIQEKPEFSKLCVKPISFNDINETKIILSSISQKMPARKTQTINKEWVRIMKLLDNKVLFLEEGYKLIDYISLSNIPDDLCSALCQCILGYIVKHIKNHDLMFLLLSKIFLVSFKAARDVIAWVIYSNDDRKMNTTLIADFMRYGLINIVEYDQYLSRCLSKLIRDERNVCEIKIMKHVISLIATLALDDIKICTPYDFIFTIETLSKCNEEKHDDAIHDVLTKISIMLMPVEYFYEHKGIKYGSVEGLSIFEKKLTEIYELKDLLSTQKDKVGHMFCLTVSSDSAVKKKIEDLKTNNAKESILISNDVNYSTTNATNVTFIRRKNILNNQSVSIENQKSKETNIIFDPDSQFNKDNDSDWVKPPVNTRKPTFNRNNELKKSNQVEMNVETYKQSDQAALLKTNELKNDLKKNNNNINESTSKTYGNKNLESLIKNLNTQPKNNVLSEINEEIISIKPFDPYCPCASQCLYSLIKNIEMNPTQEREFVLLTLGTLHSTWDFYLKFHKIPSLYCFKNMEWSINYIYSLEGVEISLKIMSKYLIEAIDRNNYLFSRIFTFFMLEIIEKFKHTALFSKMFNEPLLTSEQTFDSIITEFLMIYRPLKAPFFFGSYMEILNSKYIINSLNEKHLPIIIDIMEVIKHNELIYGIVIRFFMNIIRFNHEFLKTYAFYISHICPNKYFILKNICNFYKGFDPCSKYTSLSFKTYKDTYLSLINYLHTEIHEKILLKICDLDLKEIKWVIYTLIDSLTNEENKVSSNSYIILEMMVDKHIYVDKIKKIIEKRYVIDVFTPYMLEKFYKNVIENKQ